MLWVNVRMNKLQQMRWSSRGARRVLLARAAVIAGRLKAGAFNRGLIPSFFALPSEPEIDTMTCQERIAKQCGSERVDSRNKGL